MTKGKKRGWTQELESIHGDPNYRRKLFSELKRHVVGGYSLDCFEKLSQTMIEDLVNKYPQEFIKDELESAMRKGKQGWESIGRRQSEGTCLGNSRAWFYNMSHRYGWSEKQQVAMQHEGQVNVAIVSYADTVVKPSS